MSASSSRLHIRTVWSPDPDARKRPSGEQATAQIAPVCPSNSRNRVPELASKSSNAQSVPTTTSPAGVKPKDCTLSPLAH